MLQIRRNRLGSCTLSASCLQNPRESPSVARVRISLNAIYGRQGRNIDMETACAFWSVLVAPRYPLAQELLNFINEKGTYKGVNKDLWSMTLEFCQTISPNLEDYEADGAWPTMLDDFVAWKNNQNPSDSNGSAD
ncbi:Cullin binding-domain-containing protein [Abortiporus biennis]|nr:Cullin binding-domain-containing protein [Abortiporus biennis]